MKIFLYKNYLKNKQNFKEGIFAIITVEFVCFAESITKADEEFEKKIAKHPIKMPHIGCQAFTVEQFVALYHEEFNKNAEKVVVFQENEKKLGYIIYGLEHPWVKPQPDYMI